MSNHSATYGFAIALLGLSLGSTLQAKNAGDFVGFKGKKSEVVCAGQPLEKYNHEKLKDACEQDDRCLKRAERWGTPYVFALQENDGKQVLLQLNGKPCRTTAEDLDVVGGPSPDTIEGRVVCNDHGSLGARDCKKATK